MANRDTNDEEASEHLYAIMYENDPAKEDNLAYQSLCRRCGRTVLVGRLFNNAVFHLDPDVRGKHVPSPMHPIEALHKLAMQK